jgi:hypothetical protein
MIMVLIFIHTSLAVTSSPLRVCQGAKKACVKNSVLFVALGIAIEW